MDNTPIPEEIYKFQKGNLLVEFLYNSIPGESERLATAKWIVDNFDKAQLIKFITDMMYGIEVIKNVK